MSQRVSYWLKRTQFKTLLLLGFGFVLLISSALLSTIAQQRQNNASRWMSHSFEVLLVLGDISDRTSAIDRAGRDYSYRQSNMAYAQVRQLTIELSAQFDRLEKIVADSDTQQKRAREAHLLSNAQSTRWMELTDYYLSHPEIVAQGNTDARAKKVRGVGDRTREVQTKINSMMRQERQLLGKRQQAVRDAQTNNLLATYAFLILGIGILGFAIKSSIDADMSFRDRVMLEDREKRAEELRISEARANQQARLLSMLNTASASLASEHEISTIVQEVVDIGVELTGAEFGAFFFVVDDKDKRVLHLEALAGMDRSAFPANNFLPATELFSSHTNEVLHSDDITLHPKFGLKSPHHGPPKGHPPVRSYIGLPLMSSENVQVGCLLFGHSKPNKFTSIHTETVKGLAGMTSIVIENAQLYSSVQAELDERKKAEAELVAAASRQTLLMQELNHRVKNTLAIVQSVSMQTKNAAVAKLGLNRYPERMANLEKFCGAFDSRILSLSGTHDLLVQGGWGNVQLREAIIAALRPVIDDGRTNVSGPDVELSPNTAVTLNMVFHELATNAIKYGSGRNEEGVIDVSWVIEDEKIKLLWKESGGPEVSPPDASGFGTKLLQRAIVREMQGRASHVLLPDGLECYMEIPLSDKIRA